MFLYFKKTHFLISVLTDSYKMTDYVLENCFVTRTFHPPCLPPPSIFTLQPDFDNSVTAPVMYKICHWYICTKMEMLLHNRMTVEMFVC